MATNTLLVYFKNVVTAFEKRFTQLGGAIVARESYATGANNVNAAVSRLNSADADVVVTSTAFGELPALVGGLRSLGNTTPILNSWAGDGTYWLPKGQDIDEYYLVTYASIFGDDPSKAVKNMIASLTKAGAAPGTGGFVTGAAAIDGVVEAIRRAGGSTGGARAREGARALHEGARARRERQLLEEPAQRLRTPVPRAQDPGQQGEAGRHGSGQGHPEDLGWPRRSRSTPRGGPEDRSGPPPCRARSPASRRCARSRSRCTGTRSSG